jgi:hypothetical protein
MGHCNKELLQAVLRMIQDPAKRPSADHIKLFKCQECILAKSKKPPQRKTHPPSDTECGYCPGESLHVDGSGSPKFETADKSTQHFIIVDECSRANLVFPTIDKKPSTLIKTLKDIQAAWQTPIKKIRTDNEFAKDKDVRAFARDNCIKLEAIAPHVKPHNGMAERHHGMLQDLGRVQLIVAGASNFLWPLSVRYAAKRINLLPTSADSKKRSPCQIDETIPFQHQGLEHPPWGCLMFGHVGKRTDRNSATAISFSYNQTVCV